MVTDLPPEQLAAKLRANPGGIVLLDVREFHERQIATLEPSLHIPMSEIPGRTPEIPTDREVVVFCHGGTRSMIVAGFLEARGFSAVANLSGGIDAWSVRVDPRVPRYD